jgi:sulfur-oxidizing protein SoxZ
MTVAQSSGAGGRGAARSSRSGRWCGVVEPVQPHPARRAGTADIITQFVCTYNGDEVFRADFHPRSPHPLLTFTTVATESGTLAFRWVGDNGYAVTETATITVV